VSLYHCITAQVHVTRRMKEHFTTEVDGTQCHCMSLCDRVSLCHCITGQVHVTRRMKEHETTEVAWEAATSAPIPFRSLSIAAPTPLPSSYLQCQL